MNVIGLAAQLAEFRKSDLYAHLVECREKYKRERFETLLRICAQSADATVNALAQNILSEEVFWLELRNIDADAEALQSETPAPGPRSEFEYGNP